MFVKGYDNVRSEPKVPHSVVATLYAAEGHDVRSEPLARSAGSKPKGAAAPEVLTKKDVVQLLQEGQLYGALFDGEEVSDVGVLCEKDGTLDVGDKQFVVQLPEHMTINFYVAQTRRSNVYQLQVLGTQSDYEQTNNSGVLLLGAVGDSQRLFNFNVQYKKDSFKFVAPTDAHQRKKYLDTLDSLNVKYDPLICVQMEDGMLANSVTQFCFDDQMNPYATKIYQTRAARAPQPFSFQKALSVYQNRFDPLTKKWLKRTPIEQLQFQYVDTSISNNDDVIPLPTQLDTKQQCIEYVARNHILKRSMKFTFDESGW